MHIIYIVLMILQLLGISVGVGSSTVAVANFFVAIVDGKIDETERKMMGVVYKILRVAMAIIVVTTALLALRTIMLAGILGVSSFVWAQITMIAVLYANSALMTMRKMPSSIGPALQPAAWYALGALSSLLVLGLTNFTYPQFILGFAADFAINVALVNGMMAYLKSKPKSAPAPGH